MIFLVGVLAIVGLSLGGFASAGSATESIMLSAKDMVVDKHANGGWGHSPKHNYTFEVSKGR